MKTSPLQEKEAIQELMHKYTMLLDAEQFTEWGKLFLEDGRYELAGEDGRFPRECMWLHGSIKEILENFVAWLPKHKVAKFKMVHINSGILVELKGNRASAQSNFVTYRAKEGRTDVFAVGRYEDALAKVRGQWYFRRRKVILFSTDVVPGVIMPL